MKKSPLQQAKELFGKDDRVEAKQALVAAVKGLAKEIGTFSKVNEDKGVERVSNRKLLHLHDVFSAVKSEFSNKEGLVNAILKAENRVKDDGFKARLESYPIPRLWDHYRTISN